MGDIKRAAKLYRRSRKGSASVIVQLEKGLTDPDRGLPYLATKMRAYLNLTP
jgi:hypothetical protein